MNAVSTAQNVPLRVPMAFLYERLGWSVIPVDGSTKAPLVPWKQYATKRASMAQLHNWSLRYRNAGIAVVTGPVSQIVVLDADGAEGVEEAERLGIPKTPIVRTPRGGAHYYFKLASSMPAFRNSAKMGESRRLDVRGDSGYVVAPHTIRADGRRYEWQERPDRVELADPPAWFLKMLCAKAAPMWKPKIVRSIDRSNNGGGGSGSDDFISKLPSYIQELVRNGHDLSRFPSRSECDFAVVIAMLLAGADEELIEEIFDAYPIGEKYHESGARYLHRTIEDASLRMRVVSIKYADPVQYDEKSGGRLQLAFKIEEGADAGALIRSGVTLDSSRDGCAKRLEHFFEAVGLTAPASYEELRAVCKKLIGKRLRVELGGTRHQANPIAAFHAI